MKCQEDRLLEYLHHVNYVVSDLDEMMKYLKDTFDMDVERINTSEKAREAVYHAGVTEIQVVQPLDEESASAKFLKERGPGLNHVAFGVTRIEELFQRAVDNGNEMRRKAVSVAPRGYKTMNIERSTSQGVGFQLIEDIRPANA